MLNKDTFTLSTRIALKSCRETEFKSTRQELEGREPMTVPTIIVLGAAGAQASGLLRGLGRSATPLRIIACDRRISTDLAQYTGSQQLLLEEFDLLAEPDRLNEVLQSGDLVVNCTGPYFLLGPVILDAAIAAGTDYLDICDDADATELLLGRDIAAKAAGVTALIGMGSAPGITNILVRLALDALPEGDASVEITWCVDVQDMAGAVVPHFAHSFNTADPDVGGTPSWADLEPVVASFPAPVGEQLVVTLSHPEVLTLPRFTRVTRASNRGGLIPEDFTHLGWLLSRLPDGGDRANAIAENFESIRKLHDSSLERVGSGLLVDVRVGREGLLFASGGTTSQEEATGTPAAAGALLALSGQVPGPGVVSPEVVNPADFFKVLRGVSAGGGGLTVSRTEDGAVTDRLRIRELLAVPRAL
jgi:hypothetical protein